MNRYLIKFEKKGALRYTSHLDLLRLFRRAFKRAGIELEYSKGFNPHPKMSFAQPLSLGYTSIGEYLEFETVRPYKTDFLTGLMNSHLPYGIKILTCKELENSSGSIASLVRSAAYEVSFPEGYLLPAESQINDFLDQNHILVSKLVKKRKETTEIDIKPMIVSLCLSENSEGEKYIGMEIHTGSVSNLNPDMLLEALFDFASLSYEKGIPGIMRVELYRENSKPL